MDSTIAANPCYPCLEEAGWKGLYSRGPGGVAKPTAGANEKGDAPRFVAGAGVEGGVAWQIGKRAELKGLMSPRGGLVSAGAEVTSAGGKLRLGGEGLVWDGMPERSF